MSDNNEEILNEDQTMKTVGEIFSDVGPSHEYSAGPNIEIENWEISGRDWNDAIDSAVFPKQDKLIAGDYILIEDINGQPVISVTGIGGAGSNSWKQYSEDNDSEGDGIYIGEDNTVENEFSVAIGNNNEIDVIVDGSNEYQNVTLGNNNITTGTIPVNNNYSYSAFDLNQGENNIIKHEEHSGYKESIAANIGDYNEITNEGINIGKLNSANNYSVNIGQNNSGDVASYNIGEYNSAYKCSFAFGHNNLCSSCSTAIGDSLNVMDSSIGIGHQTLTSQSASIAIGMQGVSSRFCSIALGYHNISADEKSIAIGGDANYAIKYSIAIGSKSISAMYTGIVLGQENSLAARHGVAIGFSCRANDQAYVMGYNNSAAQDAGILGINCSAKEASYILGRNNSAFNDSFTIGSYNILGKAATAIGSFNSACGWSNIIGHKNRISQITSGNVFSSISSLQEPFTDKSHSYIIGDFNEIVNTTPNTATDKNTHPNSFVVGSYNSANHYNSYVLGKLNYTPSCDPNDVDDDGFTFAYGYANTAVRNYDMAIGLSSFASGGENLVIGAAPYEFNTITVPESERCSKAIGTCNLAIRSNISGRNNKAFQSFVSADCDGFIFNNVNFNLLDDSFIIIDNNSLEFYNNDVKKSVIRVHGNNFNYNNLYKCDGLTITAYQSDNNTFKYIENDKSLTLSASDTISRNTIISNVQGTAETNHFVDNIIMNNSKINVVSSRYISNNIILNNAQFITEQTDDKYGMNNCLINVQGKNIEGTFGFGDGSSTFVTDAIRTLCFGDFSVTHATESTIINQSTATNVEGTFIFGKGNKIVLDSPQYDNKYRYNNWGDTIHESYILGTDNYLSAENASDKISRNNIIGNKNIISVYDGISNNTIIGINNTIAELSDNITLYDLYDNDINGYTLSSFKSGPGYATYRNHILGNNNFISQYISDSKIIGHGNVIYTTTIKENDTARAKFDSLYDSSVVIGSKNILQNGSNQFAVGTFNNLSGHYAYALGNNLSAQDNQIIVGKYNEPVDNTIIFKYKYDYETSTIIEQDVSSGVIFAVSNGYFDGYEKIITDTYGVTAKIFKGNTTSATNITDNTCMVRSNAMIVSADGTVSAKKFISEEGTTYIEDAPLTGGPWVRDAGQWVQLTAYLNSLGE